jgi:hypothetical protein
MHFWDLGTGKEWRQLEGHGGTFSPDGKLVAREIAPGGVVQVVEMATGQERCRFGKHERDVFSLAFSRDGRTLATGSADTTVLLWDVTGRRKNGALVPVDLGPDRLRELWEVLGDTDAARAHRAIWELVAGGQRAVAVLGQRLKPVRLSDQEITRLVKNLDDDKYEVREQAQTRLECVDTAAEAELQVALKKGASPEARRRIETLLANLEKRSPDPVWLRHWRALEVLELIGTAEARAAIAVMAEGTPRSWLTLEAKAAIGRLANR